MPGKTQGIVSMVCGLVSIAGCCYGIESKVGFTVHGNTVNPSINGVNRFPVQLVEALCNLLIFILLFVLHRKGKFKNRLLVVYFFVYPVVRFILEFFRGDEIRGFIFGLSTSQIISILLFVFALVYTVRLTLFPPHIRIESEKQDSDGKVVSERE